MSARQGSAPFVIVIGAVAALLVGAILLTLLFFPVVNAFQASAFWSAETTAGMRILTYVGGIWEFWGGILLISILSFVWVRTRR